MLKLHSIALCIFLLLTPHSGFADEEELADLMAKFQRYAQKLGLSTKAENRELAAFYVHELHELSEELTEVKEYDGIPIAASAKQVFLPALRAMEQAVKEQSPETLHRKYSDLITSCNACHAITKHSFIVVTEDSETNPYNQDFGRR